MIVNSAYYAFKPLIPWALRMGQRQRWAAPRRATFGGCWPVERADQTPPGWQGWPEEKRFALVLTHDVEGAKGLGRVERLLRCHTDHGFRSAVNFVPEGDCRRHRLIASRTKIDTYYSDDRVVRFFPSGDVQALAGAMPELIRRKDLRDSLIAAGFDFVARNKLGFPQAGLLGLGRFTNYRGILTSLFVRVHRGPRLHVDFRYNCALSTGTKETGGSK